MNNPPQIPPAYRYYGGYTNLAECAECKAIGQYWDFHPVNPCRFCGGKIKEIGAGIWRQKVIGKKFFGLINIYEGYWEKNG